MMLTRTFARTAPDPGITADTIKPEDTRMQILHGYDLGDYPVRYATLFPMTFRPNKLPSSYKVMYTMGLGSG